MKVNEACMLVVKEVERATEKHGPIRSSHEGVALIQEEMNELWAAIGTAKRRDESMKTEAIQVSAMAMRFLIDLFE